MNRKEIIDVLEKGKKIRAYTGNPLNPSFGGWKRIQKRKISEIAYLFNVQPILVEFEDENGERKILCNSERLKILYMAGLI